MNLSQLIANAQQIPNIPKIVQELIESFGNENIDSDAIAEKINKDQAMTARVLRMANSAHYGGHRSVGSINEAVVLLGFNSLRTLVLASGLSNTVKPPISMNIKQFWHKSFMVGSLCKWLAEMTEHDSEIAFTCGMLHNIGGLLTHILDGEQAQAVDKLVAQGADRIETENDYLGFNHVDAGAELTKRWKFPNYIVEAIRHQKNPESPEGYLPFSGLIKISEAIYQHQLDVEAHLPEADLSKLELNSSDIVDKLEETQEFAASIEEILKDQ